MRTDTPDMMTTQIKVTPLQHGIAGLVFAIDSPRAEEITLFASSMLKLSGWALHNKKSVDIVLRHRHGENTFRCNRVRTDVSKKRDMDADALCGFLIPITFSGGFDVGFIVEDKVAWGARVDVFPAAKILLGKSGHLFLDNDNNNSVAQFIGQTLISDECLSLWQAYFSALNQCVDNRRTRRVFMLAPAKELVLPHYYPHPKADITPVEQFLVHFQREGIMYPKDVLSDAGDATYSKQDTHWTDYGAGIAVDHMLCKLGLSLEEPFPFDFRIVKDAGDLGVKLSVPRDQTLMKADFSPVLQHLVFDNRLKSRGLIQVFQHPEAPLAHSVVVFGDSFAYNMIPYLANAFAKVVYVLSGASIDDEIVAHEQPDLVICEITTRFLVQAPESNYSVSHDCKRKILTLSALERADYLHSLQASDQQHAFYIQKTIAELDTLKLPSLTE
ncbi:hypothetical protein [Aeromonas rivipollensis]|uniref:hypothetical protein n=1 Tax=Aeromonas rivipollensis TaxID=948519 RepID=UPI003D22457E